MRPRWDCVADLDAECLGRRPVEHCFDGEFWAAGVADGIWTCTFHDLRVGCFVGDGHALDSPTVALNELVAILIDEVWFCDRWTARTVARRH